MAQVGAVVGVLLIAIITLLKGWVIIGKIGSQITITAGRLNTRFAYTSVIVAHVSIVAGLHVSVNEAVAASCGAAIGQAAVGVHGVAVVAFVIILVMT